jgi:hypothetical protein
MPFLLPHSIFAAGVAFRQSKAILRRGVFYIGSRGGAVSRGSFKAIEIKVNLCHLWTNKRRWSIAG